MRTSLGDAGSNLGRVAVAHVQTAWRLKAAAHVQYHCLFLVRTLYGPKTHNLNQLRQLAEDIEPRLKGIWPRDTKFERRCYELA